MFHINDNIKYFCKMNFYGNFIRVIRVNPKLIFLLNVNSWTHTNIIFPSNYVFAIIHIYPVIKFEIFVYYCYSQKVIYILYTYIILLLK